MNHPLPMVRRPVTWLIGRHVLLIAALAPVLLPFAAVRAAAPPQRFAKNLEIDALTREELVAVPLDAAVYAATQEGFSDLRLLDGQGREVPFLLQVVTEQRIESQRQTWTAKDVSLRPLEEGGLEIAIRLDEKDPSPSGLSVITPLKDFEQRVRVYGGGEGEAGELLVDDALIFDYARYMDVRRHEIRLPANPYRQFRLIVDEVTAQQQSQLLEFTRRLQGADETERVERFTIDRRPFRIERIELWQVQTRELAGKTRTVEYPIAGFDTTQDAKSARTIVTIRTGSEPLTGFTLETPGRNFSRHASVEVPEVRGVRTDWRSLASATLSRIDFRDLQEERLTIRFPETRGTEYRLVIENRDSPPLEVTGIRATGNIHQVVFLADPESAYRLVYGSEAAEAPKYDTTALLAALQKGYQPVTAALGAQTEISDAGPPGFDFRRLINHPPLLIGIVCLLVALLGWGLYSTTRRLDRMPPE